MTIVIEQYNTETGDWDDISRFNPTDGIAEIEHKTGSSLRIRYIKTTCKTCKHFNWKLSGDKNWGECQNLRNIEATRISLKLVDLDRTTLDEVRNYARFNFDEDEFCCDMYQDCPSGRLDYPRTLEEAKRYRYNVWAGNPDGNVYREGGCAYETFIATKKMQCSRRNGYGPYYLYCKQHGKILTS